MEIPQILIFAVLGAIVLVVVVGGSAAMADADADAGSLVAGGAVGAGLGATAAWLTSVPGGTAASVSELVESVMKGGGAPEMRVGLPSF